MANERASKKQQELLSFVDGFIQEHGYAPSYREIMNGLGYKSVSTVAIHVDNLITKGYLSRGNTAQRSLEVVSLRPREDSGTLVVPGWKKQLLDYVESANLSEADRRTVRQAFMILGINNDSTPKNENEA